jgi:hypothetical protein
MVRGMSGERERERYERWRVEERARSVLRLDTP